MMDYPKIDSEGLRLAKQEGAARVSSVANIHLNSKAPAAAPVSSRTWKGTACQRQFNCQWPECDCLATVFLIPAATQAGCAKDAHDAFNAVDGYLNSKETSPGTFKELWEALRIALFASLPLPVAERGWQPMSSEPNDGKFRFYGLHVNHGGVGQVFEAHYIAMNEDGQLILPGGDNFDDWHFTDFEVWGDAPALPVPPLLAEQGEKS